MKILISGASVAAGEALPHNHHNPNLFVNRLAMEVLGYSQQSIDNISEKGIDNKQIFLETALALSKKDYSHALVQWQAIPRIVINFGLETYPTFVPLISPQKIHYGVNLVAGQHIPAKKIADINNFLLRHTNLHWEILDLVKYVNLLTNIANSKNIKLYFINWSMPWDHNRFFNQIDWNTPSQLDDFTNDLLQTKFRDDVESLQLYKMIHNQYALAGGIQESSWLNLYQPLETYQIDYASDNTHPGILSQEVFFNFLAQLIKI